MWKILAGLWFMYTKPNWRRNIGKDRKEHALILGRTALWNFRSFSLSLYENAEEESLATQYPVLQLCLKQKAKIGNKFWAVDFLILSQKLINEVGSLILPCTVKLLCRISPSLLLSIHPSSVWSQTPQLGDVGQKYQ